MLIAVNKKDNNMQLSKTTFKKKFTRTTHFNNYYSCNTSYIVIAPFLF